MTFAQTFGAHVMPDLVKLVEEHGQRVAFDLISFADAEDIVLQEARRRGMGHLTDHQQATLEEWMATALLDEIARLAPRVAAHHADLERWERRFAAFMARRPQPTSIESDLLAGWLE